MKKIICYHHNDHDGIVAAAVLDLAYPTADITFRMVDYTTILGLEYIDENKVDEVYFLDYSFSNEENYEKFIDLYERFLNVNKQVYWIDHHVTSVKLDVKRPDIPGVRNTSYCGAVLTWMYIKLSSVNTNAILRGSKTLKDANIPEFLLYIDDYDCWKKQFIRTNDIYYGCNIIKPTDSVFNILLNSEKKLESQEILNKYENCGIQIQKYLAFDNKNYHIDMYGFGVQFCGYKAFTLNRKANSLDFGELIDTYDLLIPFYFNGKTGLWSYSLYTKFEDVNCASIASEFGGGGHKRAAGFQTRHCIFEDCKYTIDSDYIKHCK